MANKDYIPESDEKFLDWAKNLSAYAQAHFAPWQIPSPDSAIKLLLDAYESAYAAAQNPNRGKVDIIRKNETRAALKKEIRFYVKAYLIANPAVTDEDRAAMGLPIHKTIHAPSIAPQLFIDTGTRRGLIITYKDEAADRRGKPGHVHGTEVKWAILDHPPADLNELTNSAFDTKASLILDFEEHEAQPARLLKCPPGNRARRRERALWRH